MELVLFALVVLTVGLVAGGAFKWVLPKRIKMVEWTDRKGRAQWVRLYPNPGVRLGEFQWSRFYGRGKR